MFNFVIFSKSWVSDPDPRCYSGTGNLIRCHPDPQHKYFVHKAGPGSALVWILSYHSIHVFHPLYHPMIFRILFNFFRPFLCPVYFTTGTYLVCRVSYLGAGSKSSLCVLACDTFVTFSFFLINEITHTPFLYSSMCCCCCWLKEAPTPPVIILSDVTTWVRGKGNHLSEYLGMSHTPLALSLSPTFPSSTVSYVTLRTTTGNPRVFFFIDRSASKNATSSCLYLDNFENAISLSLSALLLYPLTLLLHMSMTMNNNLFFILLSSWVNLRFLYMCIFMATMYL